MSGGGRGSPLKSQWFHILLALSSGVLHGAAVRERVLAQSDGAVKLWPAMLYGSLDDLSERGLIEELPEDEAPEAGGRRRFYRITPAGRRSLAEEAERLEALVNLVRARNPLGAL